MNSSMEVTVGQLAQKIRDVFVAAKEMRIRTRQAHRGAMHPKEVPLETQLELGLWKDQACG